MDERHVALYRRVIALLHNPGDGRFVLRIGGVSSDHSFWQLAVHRMPDWAFAITPRWIARTARIVRQSRLHVIIDLNLITALGVVAPRVPLQGPALADPRLNENWISRLLAGPRPWLDAISVHEYLYTACARPEAPARPTIQNCSASRRPAPWLAPSDPP